MNIPSKITILGVPVDVLTRPTILDKIVSLMMSGRPHHVITANTLMVLDAEKDESLSLACREASLVVADSSGISWAAKILEHARVERYPGIDLALDLCQMADQHSVPIYLLGSEPGIANQAAKSLTTRFPNLLISGMRDGFFKSLDEPALFRDIALSQARLVLVGLGMPKQELWIHQNLAKLPPAVYIGVGGTLDVWAGKVKRAPIWARKAGLEWFYRLKQEPFRWKRIARLPTFAYKVTAKKLL